MFLYDSCESVIQPPKGLLPTDKTTEWLCCLPIVTWRSLISFILISCCCCPETLKDLNGLLLELFSWSTLFNTLYSMLVKLSTVLQGGGQWLHVFPSSKLISSSFIVICQFIVLKFIIIALTLISLLSEDTLLCVFMRFHPLLCFSLCFSHELFSFLLILKAVHDLDLYTRVTIVS